MPFVLGQLSRRWTAAWVAAHPKLKLFGAEGVADSAFARHIGAGTPEQTGAVLRRGISYAVKIGLASTVALILLGPWALQHIGLTPSLAAGASAALIVFSLSLTPYLVADSMWFWLEAHGKPKVPMVVMWIANGINLAVFDVAR